MLSGVTRRTASGDTHPSDAIDDAAEKTCVHVFGHVLGLCSILELNNIKNRQQYHFRTLNSGALT